MFNVSNDLPGRQVHLDFHTAGQIADIGRDFDPDRFADTLARAAVNSITCFARCHHGYLYYPSRINAERIHPNLVRPDMLREQIEACHARGIRVPIYTTVQWDAFTSDANRHWLCIDEQGREFDTPPLKPGFYRFLDVFQPGYRQFLFDHVRELFEMLPVDGLFFDIVQPRPSLDKRWLDAMEREGLDPTRADVRHDFAHKVIGQWKQEMTDFIRALGKEHESACDCTVFYNAGHIGPRHRAVVGAYSHLELESLPSGGWGYLHFPMTQRYARGIDKTKPTLGMTGKFHTAWGDFHSYKNAAALDYECFLMLALGAGCSVGDQLHPLGELDGPTYELIGQTYRSVEAKEPWCRGATPVVEIGVFTPDEYEGQNDQEGAHHAAAERNTQTAMGFTRLLQEINVQFDLISSERDLNAYKLLIVPEGVPATPVLVEKLKTYLASGGRLLVIGGGLLDGEGRLGLVDLGVRVTGPAPQSPDFLKPLPALDAGLPDAPHVMYLPGQELEADAGATVLAEVQSSYFDRTWRHYCSHRHSPSTFATAYPGIVQSPDGNAIVFSHPVFNMYQRNAPRWCKLLVEAAIGRLLPQRLVTTDGPSRLVTALNHQPEHRRYVLHLLYYIPERRGGLDVIEEAIPLHDLNVTLRLPEAITKVTCVPEGKPLEKQASDGSVRFTLPRLDGHQMVELAY